MVENIVLVLAAAFGTVGFALMLRLRLNRLPIIAVSTALCYSLYLLVFHFSVNDFFANFTAAVFAAAVSEFLARHIKAPVTVFLTPTILPLVPGANLYYTIDAFFRGELRDALNFFSLMGRAIGAILLGIITVNTIMKCVRNYKGKQ